MNQWERLERISRVMTQLEFIRIHRTQFPGELPGIMVGELDWLQELHGLLYEA